jgi:magnesium chelatase subunit D
VEPQGEAPPEARAQRLANARLAVQLFAADPAGLGALIIRGRAGPVRDRLIDELKAALRAGVPLRRLPIGIDQDRLLGGLDLEATLARGRPVARAGLLAEADGAVLLAGMAERMASETVAQLAAAIDRGEVVTERDGVSLRRPARFGLVLLDEGDGDAAVAAALRERAAFQIDIEGLALADWAAPDLPDLGAGEGMMSGAASLTLLAQVAEAFGVASPRALLLALKVARLLAGAEGAGEDAVIPEAAVALAARLVLGPRATRLPAPAEPPPPPPEGEAPEAGRDDGAATADHPPPDLLLDAVRASLPPGLLAALAAGEGLRKASGMGAGARARLALRGRPAGTRAGRPGNGRRLALVATLRAAAPWQPLRRKGGDPRVRVTASDLRIRRFIHAAEATTILLVDASGSAAAERLAEAKGAVELLLAEAYVQRTEVALIAFRGASADLVLPPTRSLTRARRALIGLPGGGGTPLALALSTGHALALAERKRGRTPFLVALTDGRANVALDGSGGREVAAAQALAAAQRLRLDEISALLIDISARPRPEAADVASQMGARYLALPRADAARLKEAVQTA